MSVLSAYKEQRIDLYFRRWPLEFEILREAAEEGRWEDFILVLSDLTAAGEAMLEVLSMALQFDGIDTPLFHKDKTEEGLQEIHKHLVDLLKAKGVELIPGEAKWA